MILTATTHMISTESNTSVLLKTLDMEMKGVDVVVDDNGINLIGFTNCSKSHPISDRDESQADDWSHQS